ncbi:MAG: hypothetical protein SGARI_001846 [Bacillariaceae sp.]
MFALGNLANSIRECGRFDTLSKESLLTLCRTAVDCSDDSNDKVIGNAVRCVGHSGFLVAVIAPDSSAINLLERIISLLTAKLSNALTVALEREEKANYSWKQRSAAKKHGWGACHSLRIIFQGIGEDSLNTRSMQEEMLLSFKNLVLCQENYKILNQKVVSAAVMAISNLPVQSLSLIGAETGIVGNALGNAISILLECKPELRIRSNDTKERFFAQNEHVLLHLFKAASISDAYCVLTNERTSLKALDTLYNWMVEQDGDALDARAFEIFALGLQRLRRWDESVALEQKFASRALLKNKQCSEATVPTATDLFANEDEI